MNDDQDTDARETFIAKVDSEGLDYALVEYGDDLAGQDPKFAALRKRYMTARDEIREHLGILE